MPPEIARAPSTPTVLDRIVDAIEWAMVNGIWVRCSEYGIICVSSLVDVRWMKDPLIHGASPLGCAVLMHQSEKTTANEAAADALDISLAYEAGLADGLARSPKSSAWVSARGGSGLDYQKSYEQGATLRIAIRSRKYGTAVVMEDR